MSWIYIYTDQVSQNLLANNTFLRASADRFPFYFNKKKFKEQYGIFFPIKGENKRRQKCVQISSYANILFQLQINTVSI